MSDLPYTVKHPGWGELIEDAIGVNLRGLKTLWVSITTPARLFSACRTIDWEDRKYSPTLRVWLFLLAIMMFLQFLWAHPDSFLGQQMSAAFSVAAEENPILKEPKTLELALQRYVFLYPIILLLFCIVTALLVRIWGKGTTSVTRIRLFFAAVLPGMFVTLITTPFLAFVSGDSALMYAFCSFSAVMLADVLTTWRGLVPTHSIGARTWRALLLAVFNLFLYTTASTVAAILMMFWLLRDLGV